MNQAHHDEQMQAARRDFEKLWRTKLSPRIKALGGALGVVPDKKTIPLAMDVAWLAFREGQKISKE